MGWRLNFVLPVQKRRRCTIRIITAWDRVSMSRSPVGQNQLLSPAPEGNRCGTREGLRSGMCEPGRPDVALFTKCRQHISKQAERMEETIRTTNGSRAGEVL